MIRITPTLVLDDGQIEERFVRASGPGGQNVNKVSTAVQLRFPIRTSTLPVDVQDRLIALAGRRVGAGDVLVIDSREYRTQAQNREAARLRLIELLKQAARRPKTRTPTRPKAGARERRLETKRIRGSVKASRGRRAGDD